MIEALFIFFIVGTAFLVWAISRAPEVPVDPAAKLERLQEYVRWLEDRWHRAEVQNYDEDTKVRLAAELWQATEELDAAREATRLGGKAA